MLVSSVVLFKLYILIAAIWRMGDLVNTVRLFEENNDNRLNDIDVSSRGKSSILGPSNFEFFFFTETMPLGSVAE